MENVYKLKDNDPEYSARSEIIKIYRDDNFRFDTPEEAYIALQTRFIKYFYPRRERWSLFQLFSAVFDAIRPTAPYLFKLPREFKYRTGLAEYPNVVSNVGGVSKLVKEDYRAFFSKLATKYSSVRDLINGKTPDFREFDGVNDASKTLDFLNSDRYLSKKDVSNILKEVEKNPRFFRDLVKELPKKKIKHGEIVPMVDVMFAISASYVTRSEGPSGLTHGFYSLVNTIFKPKRICYPGSSDDALPAIAFDCDVVNFQLKVGGWKYRKDSEGRNIYADMRKMPFKNKMFDMILIKDINFTATLESIGEMSRILNDNGLIIFAYSKGGCLTKKEADEDNKKEKNSELGRIVSKEEIIEAFVEEGYERVPIAGLQRYMGDQKTFSILRKPD